MRRPRGLVLSKYDLCGNRSKFFFITVDYLSSFNLGDFYWLAHSLYYIHLTPVYSDIVPWPKFRQILGSLFPLKLENLCLPAKCPIFVVPVARDIFHRYNRFSPFDMLRVYWTKLEIAMRTRLNKWSVLRDISYLVTKTSCQLKTTHQATKATFWSWDSNNVFYLEKDLWKYGVLMWWISEISLQCALIYC